MTELRVFIITQTNVNSAPYETFMISNSSVSLSLSLARSPVACLNNFIILIYQCLGGKIERFLN